MGGRAHGITGSVAAAVALSLCHASAHAQESTDDEAVEEIVVTGSRIARRDFNSPSPISTLNRDQIEAAAQSTLEEVLNKMPQVQPDFGRTSNNPGNGTATINLRGFGPERGLVMLNSRRLAPSGTGSAVDVNNIPQVLIERVEIITGGASTVYGSDALAGVVNFITRDDFEGLSIEARASRTDRGDADSYDLNLAFGTDFADGAGNIVLYGGYYERTEVFAGERVLTSQPLFQNTEDGTLEEAGSGATPGTSIFFPEVDFGDSGWITFNPDGTPRPFIDPDDVYNFQPANYLQVPLERYTGGVLASWEMDNGYEWYLESNFTRNEGARELAPVPAFGFFTVSSDNPLMTAETQQLFQDYYEFAPGLAGVFFGRRLSELGSRNEIDIREYWRTVIGIRGDLPGEWDIDGWYTYTVSDEKSLLSNDGSRSRFAQSLLVDAGTGACLDPTGGCVPANIYGEGRMSPEAAAFIRVPTMTNTSKRTQQLASVFARGPLLDNWAGTIDVATGLEWRRDDGSFRADAGLFTGDTLGYRGDAAVDGIEDVLEVYAEAIIPLLGGGQRLDLELGGRISEYKNAGTTETYKYGGMWQPVDSLIVRAMAQRSVRAPNNLELFQEQFVEVVNGFVENPSDDPCSASSDPVGNGNVERCVIQGLDPAQIGVFEATPFFPVDFVLGGNPDLTPEEADTLTIGAVLTPAGLPNWSFAVDYYEIELTGAIDTNASFNICFDPVNTGNVACDNVSRGPTGDVIEVVNLAANKGLRSTTGVDFQVNYRRSLPDRLSLIGGGDIGVNLVWTHVLEDKRQDSFVSQVVKCNGYFDSPCGTRTAGSSPNNRINTSFSYSKGDLNAHLASYWIDGTTHWETVSWRLFNDDEPNLAIPQIGSKHYMSLQVGYDFSDSISASIGIDNLFDTNAPLLATSFDGTNTDVMLYDVFGRTFSVSFSMNLID